MNTETKQARLCLILAAACAVLALLFAGLWLFARHDQSDAARAAQEEAAVCRDAWRTYGETGGDEDAVRALASLYAFARDMEPLTAGTSRAEYPSYCMEVYRLLTGKPDLCRSYAAVLEKQFRLLAGDIYHVNAYAELKRLIPSLESGVLPETATATGTEALPAASDRTEESTYA